MHNPPLKLVSACLVFLVLSACDSRQVMTWPGAENAPPESLATIHETTVRIVSLDGQSVQKTSRLRTLKVPAGPHKFIVRYFAIAGAYMHFSTEEGKFDYVLKAGHTYTLDGEWNGALKKWKAGVFDHWDLYGVAAWDALPRDTPKYEEFSSQGDKLVVEFDEKGSALKTSNGQPPKGLWVAGTDRVFYPADAAIIAADEVLVWHPEVRIPVAVRLKHPTTLVNDRGPARPFRTDDWVHWRIAGLDDDSFVSSEAEPQTLTAAP